MDIMWLPVTDQKTALDNWNAKIEEIHEYCKIHVAGYKEQTECYQDVPIINKDTGSYGVKIKSTVASYIHSLVNYKVDGKDIKPEKDQETKIYEVQRDDLTQYEEKPIKK